MRKCPFLFCEAELGADIFCCRQHWYGQLSSSQRVRIWAAYRAYLANTIGVEELRRRQQEVLDETRIGGTA